MPFDPSTASVITPSFDINSAQPVDLDDETVFHEESGAVVNVPAGLDAPETDFAIQTGHFQKPKGDFFGMVEIGKDKLEEFGRGALSLLAQTPQMIGAHDKEFSERLLERREALEGHSVFLKPPRQLPPDASKLEQAGAAGIFRFPGPDDLILNFLAKSSYPDRLKAAGDGIIQRNRDFLQESGLLKTEDDGLAYDLGSGTSSIGVAVALSVLTKNPGYAAVLFGDMQKTQSYIEAREKGMSPSSASQLSDVLGLTEGTLEFLGNKIFLDAAGLDKPLKRIVARAVEESLQEGTQQGAEETITQTTGLRPVDIQGGIERTGYAAMVAVLVGAPVATVVEIAEKTGEQNGIPKGQAQAIAKKLVEQTEKIQEAGANILKREASKLTEDEKARGEAAEVIRKFAAGEGTEQQQAEQPLDDKFLFNLDTETLEREMARAAFTDDEKLIDALGAEKAALFKKLDRAANSMNPNTADEAQAKLDELVKDFTPEQERLVYGIGEIGATAEDYKEILAAHSDATFTEHDTIQDIARSTANAMMGVDPLTILNVATKGGTVREQARFIRITKGIKALRERGIDRDQIAQTLVNGLVQGGAKPSDAAEIVGGFIDSIEQAAKTTLRAPMKTAPIQRIDATKEHSPVEIARMSVKQRQAVMREKLKTARNDRQRLEIENAYGQSSLNQLLDNRKKRGLRGKIGDTFSDFGRMTRAALVPISTRLKAINPKLKVRLRRFEFSLAQRINADQKVLLPFLQKYSRLSDDDKIILDYAMKNGHADILNEIARANDMTAEFAAVREALEQIYQRAESVGYKLGYQKNFFPRHVLDAEGLLNYFEHTEIWNEISMALMQKELELSRPLSTEEKAHFINTLLRGYKTGLITLAKPGALKERSIDEVTPEINEFYSTSDQALIRYFTVVNEAIEARKFFGKLIKPEDQTEETITALETEIAAIDNQIDALNLDNLTPEEKANYRKLSLQRKKAAERLDAIVINDEPVIVETKDIEDSIGYFVLQQLEKGEITAPQARELSEILKARFNRGQMSAFWRSYKNLSYIDTMGSVTSAITQLGDVGYALYKSGAYRTMTAATRATAGKSEITREDIGVTRIAQEFEDGSTTANAVNTVFKLTGLNKMDTIGKETLINAAIQKYRKLAKNPTDEFRAQLSAIFEDQTDSVIADLQNKVNSENVKLLLFNDLLDLQPVALSEMPEAYLKMGNGRIFYMLKTFTIKQLDIYRNEVFEEIRSGNPVKGLTNLTRLLAFFVMMNAGADFLKDLLLGRETPPDDMIVNNILRAAGISKFQVYTARKEGIGTAAAKTILPPFKFIDSLYKDMDKAIRKGEFDPNELKTIDSIPLVGKLYYWWFGAGSQQ